MTFHIACIGEPMAEISRNQGNLTVAFGGDTLNTAIYCARAATGADIAVHYVTALGLDALSEAALELMTTEDISTEYVTRDPHRQIGIYAIQNDENGERSFHYWRETSAARELFSSDGSVHLEAINNTDLVYLSGITLAVISQQARNRLWSHLAARRASGLQVAFDSNYRPKLWETIEIAREEIGRFWEITDVALPSHEDEAELFGNIEKAEIASRILAAGAKSGALKCGSEGPFELPNQTSDQTYPAARNVVDTTGAGDSFNGAYLAAIACGKPAKQALLEAHTLASRVVGHQGAIQPLT